MENNLRQRMLYACRYILFSVLFVIIFEFGSVNSQIDYKVLWKINHNTGSRTDKFWTGIGYCRNEISLLGDYIGVEDICAQRRCIGFIDMLELASGNHKKWNGLDSECYPPTGGQVLSNKTVTVSFIFILRNNPTYAAKAIVDVFKTMNEIDSGEIIVYDDASTADMSLLKITIQKLRTLFGVRISYYAGKTQLGYGKSNNLALAQAKGEYAVLVNSDVFVTPGWLALLMHTMNSYPAQVAMVGPMILNRNNTVVEAGGVMYRFGEPINFGRRKRPLELPMLHARVVDYISAACLLIRRKLFLESGLFDPRYENAYYEDADAAFTLLSKGWVTVLQPLSVVYHLEGTTYGQGEEKLRLMANNSVKFYQKHKAVLDSYCPIVAYNGTDCEQPAELEEQIYASFYRQQNRILILEDVVPEPDRDAGSIRLLEILDILLKNGYSVTFEPMPVAHRAVKYMIRLLADGVNVVVPGTLAHMAAGVSQAMNICPWDVIFIARRYVFAHQIKFVKELCPFTRIIFDTGKHFCD